MSTAALPASSLSTQTILQRLREYVLPLAANQRDLRHAGAAARRSLDLLLALSMAASVIVFLSACRFAAPSNSASFPPCCCCSPFSGWR